MNSQDEDPVALVFEWHEDKAKSNEAKQGVSFEEARTIFNDPNLLTFEDLDHSDHEARYLSLGISWRGRLWIAAFTETNEAYRLISCRKATARERKTYEEGL